LSFIRWSFLIHLGELPFTRPLALYCSRLALLPFAHKNTYCQLEGLLVTLSASTAVSIPRNPSFSMVVHGRLNARIAILARRLVKDLLAARANIQSTFPIIDKRKFGAGLLTQTFRGSLRHFAFREPRTTRVPQRALRAVFSTIPQTQGGFSLLSPDQQEFPPSHKTPPFRPDSLDWVGGLS